MYERGIVTHNFIVSNNVLFVSFPSWECLAELGYDSLISSALPVSYLQFYSLLYYIVI